MTLQQIMSPVRRAIDDFKMIQSGDVIEVGLSGGKDSITLLSALAGLKRFYPEKSDVIAVRIDTGLEFNKEEEVNVDLYNMLKGTISMPRIR